MNNILDYFGVANIMTIAICFGTTAIGFVFNSKNIDKKIKELQLSSLQTESEDNKKASMFVERQYLGSGKEYLVFTNKGKSKATNIRYIWNKNMLIIFDSNNLPFPLLNAGESFSLSAQGYENGYLQSKIIWDDDFKTDNEKEVVLLI